MTDFTQTRDFSGRTLVDRNGDKIGKVDEVYTDAEGGEPRWALVQTGLLGTKKSFVPLQGATPSGDDVRVPVDKDAVKGAPGIDADEELTVGEERRLYEHYGVSGDTTADDAMTRSEEELRVGRQSREAGRARLRKYVVTEEVQQTVPVRREEVRIEREPITDANVDRAHDGPDISEDEHEVVLHEEQPVVEKRTVPKERVRLETETVTDEEQVSDEVRKERIDVDDEDRRA